MVAGWASVERHEQAEVTLRDSFDADAVPDLNAGDHDGILTLDNSGDFTDCGPAVPR